MKFTDIFIRRPVLATVISLLIFVVGLGSIFTLQLRQYPEITSATLTITTSYPGANASVMQGFVTTPLEQAIGSVDGIDYMTSSSTTGLSTITVQLRLNWDPEKAMTDISQQISSVKSQLPTQALASVITKSDSNSFPGLILAFTSDTMSKEQISAYLKNELSPKIFALGGISTVNIMGNMPFAMRIWMNPKKMALLGVTPSEVKDALAANSVISSSGNMKGEYMDIDINAHTNMTNASEYKKLVVANNKGHIIRLEDVAKVELSSQIYDTVNVLFDGKTGVFAGITVSPDANSLSVIDNVISQLPTIDKLLPHGLKMSTVYNSTTFIKVSINEVIKTIIEAIIIVVVVMLIFLGSFRAVFVPLVTIPLSLVGVFFLMNLMGFSINLLTLLAMVLAIGLVVDDAIVVLENIYRHVEEGKTPFQAAILGAREIVGPVIVMTLTLAAVYAPIGMLGGLTGSLFTEFAYTLAAAVIISGIIALTLTPMMCSKIVSKEMLESRLVVLVDRVFAKLSHAYGKSLNTVITYRPAILLLIVIVLGSCYFMFAGTKAALAPTEDTGLIMVQATAPSPSNLAYLESYTPELEKIQRSFSATLNTFLIAGYPNSNTFFGGMVLKPWDQRSETQMALKPLVQQKLNKIAGLQAYAIEMPPLPGSSGGLSVQFVLKSTLGYPQLYSAMEKVIAKANQSGLFLMSMSSLRYDKPQLEININRSKASALGISMNAVGKALGASYSGYQVNYFSMLGYSYQVIPQLGDQYRMNAQQLGNIRIKTGSGDFIPLSEIFNFSYSSQPSSYDRFQQLNSATFSAVPSPGVTSGQALAFLQQTANSVMPEGMETDTAGPLRQYVQSGNALIFAFAFAIIVIFLLLSAQFESFRDPLVILISVPLAISGALIPIYIGSTLGVEYATINIYTQIGFITLIGLISKHGILIVEFANKLQEKGMSKIDAIKKSSATRLRPILMTTAAMACGVIPLMISSGAGAESRHAIGVVIFFGMVIGTIFTLFVVPSMYTYIAKDRRILMEKHDDEEKQLEELANDTSASEPH